MQRIPCIYFGPSELGGRGVFTSEDLPKGALLEICPVIIIPEEQLELIHSSVLHDYYFFWGIENKKCAIALGFGSLYNHACPSNADYDFDYENKTIDIRAVEDIPAGAEITINYMGDPTNNSPTWFQAGGKRI